MWRSENGARGTYPSHIYDAAGMEDGPMAMKLGIGVLFAILYNLQRMVSL
jgi:hypothetical protein